MSRTVEYPGAGAFLCRASATASRCRVAMLGRGFVSASLSMNATVSAAVRRLPASTLGRGSSRDATVLERSVPAFKRAQADL